MLEISLRCCLIRRKHRLVLFYTFTDGFVDAELQIFDIVGIQGEERKKDL